MTTLSPEDELLVILLRNLRNAAATFGEGTAQHESIRQTVEEHLRDMQRNNKTTNITQARDSRESRDQGSQQSLIDEIVLPAAFANLAIRTRTDSYGMK